jgi:hypothetical protein
MFVDSNLTNAIYVRAAASTLPVMVNPSYLLTTEAPTEMDSIV